MSLYTAAKKIRDAFKYDPGHSDLDNDQPIHIFTTLGDWRRLHYELQRVEHEARPDVKK
jgi:hypothetical protein